ncbi:MAG: restriction endonuclease subunit S [Anaerobutyricum hallii]
MKYANYRSVESNWLEDVPIHWDFLRLKMVLQERKEKNNPVVTDNILSLTANQGVIPVGEKEGSGGNKPKEDLTLYNVARENDLLVNCMNVVSGAAGVSKYTGAISPVYYALTPRDSKRVNIWYYHHLFRMLPFQRSLLGLGKGILMHESNTGKLNTVRMRISMDYLNNTMLPIPPIEEQNQIVAYIDWKSSEINKLIKSMRKQMSLLIEQKDSLIFDTVFSGIGKSEKRYVEGLWFNSVGKKWDVKRIKYLFDLRDERNYKPLSEVNLISLYTKLGVVQNSDVEYTTGNRATNADGYKIVYEDDIVVNIILCWMGAMGRSAYNGVTSPAYDIYKPQNDVCSRYYHYLFRTKPFIEQCYKEGRGIMAMRWRTYSSQFRGIKVPVPPYMEQIQIADWLDDKCRDFDNAINSLQSQIDLLNEIKTRLVFDAITGKKDIRNIEIPDYITIEDMDEASIDEELTAESIDEEV